jgi:hypothetical protein
VCDGVERAKMAKIWAYEINGFLAFSFLPQLASSILVSKWTQSNAMDEGLKYSHTIPRCSAEVFWSTSFDAFRQLQL